MKAATARRTPSVPSRLCENCGHQFPRGAGSSKHNCSPICLEASRARRARLAEYGRPVKTPLERGRHPVPSRTWPRAMAVLSALAPPIARAIDRRHLVRACEEARAARVVLIPAHDLASRGGDGAMFHDPPQPCQLCDKPVTRTTGHLRGPDGQVYCTARHKEAHFPGVLHPACPRPDKERWETAEAAAGHRRAFLQKAHSLHVYQCECRWHHIGNRGRTDETDTIGARARFSKLR